jgi:hypothetical protein
LDQRSHEKKPSRTKSMQYLYILSLLNLLLSTAHAGKGKFKTPNKNSNIKEGSKGETKVTGMSMKSLTIHAVMMSTGLKGVKDAGLKTNWFAGLFSIDGIEYKATNFYPKSSIHPSTKSTTLMFHDNIGNGNFMVKFELMSEKEGFRSLFTQFCSYAKAQNNKGHGIKREKAVWTLFKSISIS